jgi:hypothetical protein
MRTSIIVFLLCLGSSAFGQDYYGGRSSLDYAYPEDGIQKGLAYQVKGGPWLAAVRNEDGIGSLRCGEAVDVRRFGELCYISPDVLPGAFVVLGIREDELLVQFWTMGTPGTLCHNGTRIVVPKKEFEAMEFSDQEDIQKKRSAWLRLLNTVENTNRIFYPGYTCIWEPYDGALILVEVTKHGTVIAEYKRTSKERGGTYCPDGAKFEIPEDEYKTGVIADQQGF